ncbi:MAG: hypothetical protein KDD04_00845 [Sinomicrobium sp.]|nr:hypothetical protein [Sinomicrobium sp.]
MKISKTAWWIIAGAGVVGLSVGGYSIYKRKRPKTDKYGRREDKSSDIAGGVQTSRAGGQALTQPDWSNPYDMNYQKDVQAWIAPKKLRLLPRSEADTYAKQLKAAGGGAWYKNDDEKAVEGVFAKKLRDKVAVASLSRAFWDLYKKDMWQHLAGFLSKKEMEKYVHAPVRKLPNYRILN